MKYRFLALVSLVLAAGLSLGACGGGSSDADSAVTTLGGSTTTLGGAVTTTASEASVSPADLGDAITATWVEAMQKLIALLQTKPEPSAIRGQVEQLKEEYIVKLVGFGRQRLALSTGDNAEVTARTTSGLAATADEAWYATYTSLYQDYSSGDQEFAALLASFNILTQYAEFELLKQQAPEEAARLGIE